MSEEPVNYSTSDHLHDFSKEVKVGLAKGQNYIKLVDQLVDTADFEELLSAAQQLLTFDIDSEYVKFPHLHSAADFYLMFVERFLQMHDNSALQIEMNQADWSLTGHFSDLSEVVQFKFKVEQSDNGGAFFTEQKTGEKLFYLNLERRMIRINNHSLINLFVVDLAQDFDPDQLEMAISPIISLINYLKQDLGFSIDLGILDTDSSAQYFIQKTNLSLTIIDKLFVRTNETGYMLMNVDHGVGAKLLLDHKTNIQILQAANGANWYFKVEDEDDSLSLFDVLVNHDVIKNWYLDNRDELEVKTDPLIFA